MVCIVGAAGSRICNTDKVITVKWNPLDFTENWIDSEGIWSPNNLKSLLEAYPNKNRQIG